MNCRNQRKMLFSKLSAPPVYWIPKLRSEAKTSVWRTYLKKSVIASTETIVSSVTVLTKKTAEELNDFLTENGILSRYLHSDIKTDERQEIINGLRAGEFDVLIGISLLREGLDIPEASLVAILDADHAGFLRSSHALIQMIGRVARNVEGKAVLYANRITPAMKQAMDETHNRRERQIAYNRNIILNQ